MPGERQRQSGRGGARRGGAGRGWRGGEGRGGAGRGEKRRDGGNGGRDDDGGRGAGADAAPAARSRCVWGNLTARLSMYGPKKVWKGCRGRETCVSVRIFPWCRSERVWGEENFTAGLMQPGRAFTRASRRPGPVPRRARIPAPIRVLRAGEGRYLSVPSLESGPGSGPGPHSEARPRTGFVRPGNENFNSKI